MTTNLNYYCLKHLFSFCTPKEWVQFGKVCQKWKTIATSSKDFEYFSFIPVYIGGNRPKIPDDKKLEICEFIKIFNFVVKRFKYVRFQMNSDEIMKETDVCVTFGHFTYFLKLSASDMALILEKFLAQTKNVEKLKVNAFAGASKFPWKQFFRTNPLECFKFIVSELNDVETFLNRFISVFPSSIEQIGFEFVDDSMSDLRWLSKMKVENSMILPLLRRMPRLTKVHFTQDKPFSFLTAREIVKHAKTLKELCIKHRLEDLPGSKKNIKDFTVLARFVKLTNLTKLNLTGFALLEDWCERIVEYCRTISCLKIVNCVVPEPSLQVLMSLPNLSELHISTNAMNFTTEVARLRNLVIDNYDEELDDKRLANTLKLMPNLSSLMLVKENSLTESAARIIKQTAHSRGQTISLYSKDYTYRTKTFYHTKLGEIAPESNLKGVFKLIVVLLDEVMEDNKKISLLDIIKQA